MDVLLRLTLRLCLRVYLALLAGARRVGGPPAALADAPVDVLLTLNFHAPGWPRALLGPLARAPRCARLRLVTTVPVTGLDGVDVIHPPRWLVTMSGATLARLATFAAVAIRTRPPIVGGVHLLFNGLVAALVARLSGSRALYVCVGGPNEVAGGGLLSENRAFGRLATADATIERLLLEAVSSFDGIVTMGTRAAAWFRAQGVTVPAFVVPSGVDAAQFPVGGGVRDVDIVLVARLVPVKRIDRFVETVAGVARAWPTVRAVVIGTGPEREGAERLAQRLGVGDRIAFLGHEPDVSAWLRRARVFLLTSDTEGVSISLIEAMLSGAVPVVSNVGDLADVVTHGVSGALVHVGSAGGYVAPIVDILRHPDRWADLSAAAREAAGHFTPEAITPRWNDVLSGKGRNGHG